MSQDSSSGYEALRHGAAVIRRDDTGLLLVSGADRLSYLQGLLTNDIEALSPDAGCYAAMLTAQGRMITDLHVYETGDEVLLTVPAALTGAIRDHLEQFVFSEDVQVEDVTASIGHVSLYGPQARALTPDLRAATRGSFDADAFEGLEYFVDLAAAGEVAAALIDSGAETASMADLEIVRIERGIPRFGIDMDTDTIPLEAGIEGRALSRTKGCYVGQEVIVRVLDRGQGRVARRLVGLLFATDAVVPARGSAIVGRGREIGRITSAAFSPDVNHPIALGYVHRDFVEPGTAVTVDQDPVTVTALPFL